MSTPSIFQRIINGEIPARIEHSDETCIAIHDLNPQAPTHLLIIPRRPIKRLAATKPGDGATLGHLLLVAKDLAKKLNLEEGFRIVINNGPHGGESVPHLHVHLLGGRPLTWPPG